MASIEAPSSPLFASLDLRFCFLLRHLFLPLGSLLGDPGLWLNGVGWKDLSEEVGFGGSRPPPVALLGVHRCRMKVNKRSTSDIISNLPSNVTENILKGLPLRDAVRTSVLSSKWRYKWVSLPQLVFDGQFFLKGWDNVKLKAVVYQVLQIHQGPLIKFEFWYPPFESCLDMNNWIFVLLTKNIQDFTFYLLGGPRHEIPCHFYSFMQLRDLNLDNCVFKPPPTFKGFSRLVNLNFVNVTISSEICGLFISNCLQLERLRLHDCDNFDSLEINAPNLKYFELFGIFESVYLENTPLLAEISVTLGSWIKQPLVETGIEWVKFFHSLPAIEDMHLDSSILESFDAGNVPERLPCTLNQLKVLVLSDVCYSNLDHVSWALCLLRSSPNLHKLRSSILFNDITPIEDNVIEFLQAQDFSKFSLNRLREVEIRHFSGAKPEIHFVKILLAHSKVLEKMVILHEHGMCAEKGFAMLKELIRLPKASLKAEFIVSETPDE
ncbi:hypothetical protein RHSIM_Rhsim12G0069300 [Rhododendron simsii]|uniref:F-box domain-containing protein n=1 Tax=Rhododendron simsii TaxID=118357 RepID=A0A834G574_RHOSS|nr:hypothetical protein RHSIM_Rhsim12G0069300 [Rhododendron simsii]